VDILLKDKIIQGITIDGSIDGSVEIGEVFQFFCAILACVEVQGSAHLVIDNTPGTRVEVDMVKMEVKL